MTVKEALEIAKLNRQVLNGEILDKNTELYKRLKQYAVELDTPLYYVIKEHVDTALGVLEKEVVRLRKNNRQRRKKTNTHA
jgi:hypothetical protein